jgi:hypothetical protein
MTLKYMQGFETLRQDSDLRAQGFVTTLGGSVSGFVPSTTGINGYGLVQLSAAGSPQGNIPGQNASYPNVGGYAPGITINQGWTAGGFTLGFSARSNSGTQITVAPNPGQLVFDGSTYWAIVYNGTSYLVAKSTNLNTWTILINQPASIGSLSTVSFMGSNTIMVTMNQAFAASGITYTVYYSSNGGLGWASQTLGTASNSSTGATLCGIGCATGNSTYPHCIIVECTQPAPFVGNTQGIYIGTLGGTFTMVTRTIASWSQAPIRPRIINGYLVVSQGGYIGSAHASSSSLNTAGAWTQATTQIPGLTDMALMPSANLWAFSSSTAASAISTTPNSGSSSSPVPPSSGALTLTNRYTTNAMYGIQTNSSGVTTAFGAANSIQQSSNGSTWTALTSPSGSLSVTYSNAYYDGSQYILTTGTVGGFVATTPDCSTNYKLTYASDKTPSGTASAAFDGFTVWPTTSAPVNNTAWPQSNNFVVPMLSISAVSSGIITYYLNTITYASGATTNIYTGTISATPFSTHYYEMKFVADAANGNKFFIKLYIDNQLITTTATSYLMAINATDTSTVMVISPIPRGQQVSQVDDMYLTLDNGSGLTGPLGPINIIARHATTDVQDQWSKTGTASSNSASITESAYSSSSPNYISVSTDGSKDIYSSSTSLPNGYQILANEVEGYFKASAGTPTVSVGILSNATETDSAQVTVSSTTTPSFVSVIAEKDPNGNVAWTNTSVVASKITVNKIS